MVLEATKHKMETVLKWSIELTLSALVHNKRGH